MDIRPEEIAYKTRMKESDVANRLNMLFGKGQAVDDKQATDAAYETVNEGNTTDTTSGLDEESIVNRHENYERLKKQKEMYQGREVS